MNRSEPKTDDASDTGQVPVAIYTRVSTDNQVGGRFDSLESQAAICREKIHKRAAEGWHEVACFTDAAYSGGTMNRPGIQALKRQIEAGQVKVVLIFKLERVLRSTDEWVPFRAFLQKYGCRLESATEDLSEATASGRLKNNVLMSVAEYERQNTAEKVRAKMGQQARQGFWNGGIVPYGYAYDEKNQMLKLDPRDAPVVHRIFEEAAKLTSLTDLANALNAEGMRTKERLFRRRDGAAETVGKRLFRSDRLRLIIRNPIYRGVVRFAQQEFSAKHEPLVPTELWNSANAAVAETKTRAADIIVERDLHIHLLKGLAYCGHCGRTLVPHASGKKDAAGKPYRYYNCGFVLRERQPDACPVGRISADALERAVVSFLGEVGKHPTLITGVLEAARSRNRGDRKALRVELDLAERTFADANKELGKCVDAVARGGLDILGDALTQRVQKLRVTQQQLSVDRERKRQALAACDTALLDEQRVRNSIEQLGMLLPGLEPQEQKELVRLFIQRVELHEAPVKRRLSATTEGCLTAQRILAMRIKLHLPQLIQGVGTKQTASLGTACLNRPVAARGLSFETQVDFTHAMAGEVTIIAPFQHTVRVDSRVRVVRPPEPAAEHAVIRAQKWRRMLEQGKVANRVALAKRMGITPGAVTRILKLVELSPDIQQFLASLKTKEDLRSFPIKEVGRLAILPVDKQRTEFTKMRQRFTAGIQ